MKSAIKLAGLLLLTLSVTACSWFGKEDIIKNRKNDYIKAQSYPNLQMPANVKLVGADEKYKIPDVSNPYTGELISLLPPGSLAAKKAGEVGHGNVPGTRPLLVMTTDNHSAPELIVAKPFATTWDASIQALTNEHYKVLKTNKQQKLLAVVEPSSAAASQIRQHAYVINMRSLKGATALTVSLTNSLPAPAADAKKILTAIGKQLPDLLKTTSSTKTKSKKVEK